MYEPKNIVICLDGTGNQIETNVSNVLKFYRCLRKTSSKKRADNSRKNRQAVYYDQGVGTVRLKNKFGALRQGFRTGLGLMTGWGMDRNVLNAYRFLVKNYEEHAVDSHKTRDRVFIFGFSRGAHTARVLAAFIHNMGVLTKDQIHLSEAAFTAYKGSNSEKHKSAVSEFNRITQPRFPAIDFLGVWDTVSSVITPRPDRFYIPMFERLPNTTENPSVKVFRHAMAIDEKRRMYKLDEWIKEQMFKRSEYSQTDEVPQDSLEVWFSGYHSDVGGGKKRETSGISQIPLIWMIQQVNPLGLKFTTNTIKYVAQGDAEASGDNVAKYNYPKPSATAKIHPSGFFPWVVFEVLPGFGRGKRLNLGLIHFPFWRPRPIPEGAVLHASAIERKRDKPKYKPANWPASHTEFPYDHRSPTEWDESLP